MSGPAELTFSPLKCNGKHKSKFHCCAGGPGSSTLEKVFMEFTNRATCTSSYDNAISKTMVCADGKNNEDVCDVSTFAL